uniref:Reverse transcriptase Ty1/copia-type domain-containing protein n=1 Tax=Tanacetum cinerariifolium TaxID=118510 RepID=A0A6L2LR43_TANCI|nr:hypothetical protein [Tanacetum cinerariifolium]
MPNIEERRRPVPKRDENPPPHFGIPFEPLNENDGGDSQGLTASASKRERSADLKDLQKMIIQKGWTLYQMDINIAFLYRVLSETLYMSLPPGYLPSDEKKVCKLNRSSNNVFIALLGYVDDIFVVENNLPEIEKFKEFLKIKI